MIHYIYNGDSIIGFIYNDNKYYYHKNIFTDIIGIYNSNYNEIVTYEYDSFGNITNIIDNSNINIGTINPFRYRSYYYDNETGLYYLNARYYNPEWGRFINSDNYASTGQGILGHNMFVYCGNNPIIRKDDEGGAWWIPACTIVGGIVGGAAKAIDNVAHGEDWYDGVVGAAVGGALAGGLAATGHFGAVEVALSASFAEATSNEILSYTSLSKYSGSEQKNISKVNLAMSVTDICGQTLLNTGISLIAEKITPKSMKTNTGWIKPKKFVSSFTGKYAQKNLRQNIIETVSSSALGNVLDGISKAKNTISVLKKQVSNVTNKISSVTSKIGSTFKKVFGF